MIVIGSSGLHYNSQTLTFNITYVEGSVILTCPDALSPGLLQLQPG